MQFPLLSPHPIVSHSLHTQLFFSASTMAEISQPKRQREESHEAQSLHCDNQSNLTSKRHKPYNTILSLLYEEEEEEEEEGETRYEPSQDLSAILTTLQQEISSSATSCDSTNFDFDALPCTALDEVGKTTDSSTSEVCSPSSGGASGEDEGVKSVMRHLLEASDDELGIPNREDNLVEISSGENHPFAFTDHGLWEFEDETANYYAVLQSELFM